RFFREMLEEGIYLAPSQFECAFVSTAHSDEHINKTIEAARTATKVFADDDPPALLDSGASGCDDVSSPSSLERAPVRSVVADGRCVSAGVRSIIWTF